MKLSPRFLLAALLSAAFLLASGCKNNQNQNAANGDTAATQNPTDDPANANVAPISNASQSGSPAQQSDQYAGEQYPPDQSGNYDNYNDDNYDQATDYAPDAPPPLPQYDQPPCPGDGYIWTPGYWNYASDGYYWVPGAWVMAPYSGALWTPGYWGYDNQRHRYGWHLGFWGRHVGYYGGINYGFGYTGYGYQGGYWNGDRFDYNRTVNNINVNVVHNVYNYRINNNQVNRVSFNGPGGIQVRPRPAEVVAVREQHAPPMSAQVQQVQAAKADRGNFAAVNHGRPQMVAVTHPLPADHDIHPPALVPMRQPAPAAGAGHPGQPQPKTNQPAPVRNEPTPPRPEPTPKHPEPAPVQHPERQQPAPQHQAPQQHAQPAPERREPVPQRPTPEQHPAQQRPAPVEHPQTTPQQHSEPSPQQHPAEQRPAPAQHPAQQHPTPEHKNPPPKKPDEQRPQ